MVYIKENILILKQRKQKVATSFPLKNFHDHQIEHMNHVSLQGGYAFVIIRFSVTDEIYLMVAKDLFIFWERMKAGGRKSISFEEVKDTSIKIPLGFQPRIDYIKVIDSLIF